MCYPGWIPIPTTLTGLVFINVNEYRVDEYLNWLQKCSCLLMPCVLGMLLIHSMHTGPIHQFWPIIQLFVYSLLVPIERKVIYFFAKKFPGFWTKIRNSRCVVYILIWYYLFYSQNLECKKTPSIPRYINIYISNAICPVRHALYLQNHLVMCV